MLTPKQLIGLFAGLQLALFLSALDQTVLNTAIPKMSSLLHGFDRAPWIITSYLLFSTVATPVSGKLADLFGVKKVLIVATLLFAAASLLCGLAPGMNELIAARALQGIGGGAMIALCFIAVGDLFPARERGKYQGLLAAAFIVAAVIGPTLGGVLVDANLWRFIFWMNIPLGALAVICLYFFFPASSRERAATGDPLIPISLFKNLLINICLITVFVSGIGLFGGSLLMAVLFQQILKVSAASSGMALTPIMLVVAGSSILSGFILAKTGRYKWLSICGLVLMCLGSALLATIKYDSQIFLAIVYAGISGIGLGLLLPIHAIVVQNVVAESILGIATSMTQFSRSLGGTIGTGIMSELLLILLRSGSMQSAVSIIFLIYASTMLVVIVLNFFLEEVPLKKSATA